MPVFITRSLVVRDSLGVASTISSATSNRMHLRRSLYAPVPLFGRAADAAPRLQSDGIGRAHAMRGSGAGVSDCPCDALVLCRTSLE